MNEFNPQKIDTLRDLKGWTIGHLSEVSDVSSRRISDMAKGLVSIRQKDVESFALASGFPISFFALEEEKIPATELTFRAPSRTNAREKKRVTGEYRVLKSAVHHTAQITGFENSSNWIETVSPSGTPDMQDIENLALESRARMGVPSSGPIANVVWSLEGAGIIVAPMTAPPATEAARPEGVSFPTSGYGPATIGYFAGRRTGDGIRFTVSHEFGHLLVQRKRRPASRSVIEREASVFAGAFLLPRKDALSVFSPRMTLDEYKLVKARYGISIAASIMRARQVGIIDKDRQQSLMAQMSIRHWRSVEPVLVDEEHPVLFKQMLGKACGKINSATDVEINEELASQFTGMPFEFLKVWTDGIRKMQTNWDMDLLNN